MTGRHREERTTVDMVPGRLRRGTKQTAAEVGGRYMTRPIELNETGKLEWVYLPGVRHGAHDATPTIAEIAATEPCEKTTGWPTTSCATSGDLRITSDEWATSYCLPCRIRAALDRQEHRPLPDPFKPWPVAATELIHRWIAETRFPRYWDRPEMFIELLNTPDPYERHPIVKYRMHFDRDDRMVGEFEEFVPRDVVRRAHYIATGEWL